MTSSAVDRIAIETPNGSDCCTTRSRYTKYMRTNAATAIRIENSAPAITKLFIGGA